MIERPNVIEAVTGYPWKSLAEVLAAYATILGILFAIISIVIAWLQARHQKRLQAEAQIEDAYARYLEHRRDHSEFHSDWSTWAEQACVRYNFTTQYRIVLNFAAIASLYHRTLMNDRSQYIWEFAKSEYKAWRPHLSLLLGQHGEVTKQAFAALRSPEADALIDRGQELLDEINSLIHEAERSIIGLPLLREGKWCEPARRRFRK